MRKTILTMLTALLFASGAWATDFTAAWGNVSSGNMKATLSPNTVNATASNAVLLSSTVSFSFNGTASVGGDSNSGLSGSVTATKIAIPASTTTTSDVEMINFTLKPKENYTFTPSVITFYAATNSFGNKKASDNEVISYAVYSGSTVVKAKTTPQIGRADSGTGLTKITINSGLGSKYDNDKGLTLKLYLKSGYNQSSAKNIVIYGVSFSGSIDEAPAGPTITAQTIADANYVQGTDAASVTALSVTAAASAGDLSYQWYKNTANSTTTPAPTAIDGATSNSYKPTTSESGTLYYFCKVTDDNGSVYSEIAKIVVSAATAPTINVSGAGNVVRGGEITLTAEFTGVPDPSIAWYACSSVGVISGEPLDEDASFSPSTSIVGTYYFRAVVNNGVGGDASNNVYSEIQIISINPKTPSITAGGYFFADSKSVTIAKADGEDGSAVIKYSTDGGANWNDYSEALSITETTTVKAKVVQSGLESAEVSATYTKFVKSELVVVSGRKTWNFNDNVFNTERSITSSTFPALDEEYTFADFAIINDFSLPSGFDGTTLAYIGSSAATTAYPSRNKGAQAVNLHIKTSTPGKLTVTFSDTGSSIDANAFKRYLNINGTNTEYYTSRPTSGSTKSNDKKTVTTNVIPIGDIWIKAMKEDGETETMICIYDVTFTPTEAISTADGQTYGTYVTTNNLDFSEASGISAYKITGVENGVIQTAALTQVPSGTPILIETASAGATINVPFAASTPGAITENRLKVGAAGIVSDENNYRYVLAAQGGVTGFYKLTSAKDVPADRAYLELTVLEAAAAPSMIRIIDEENSATNVENIESEEKAVKFIENGRILIKKNGIVYDALGRVIR